MRIYTIYDTIAEESGPLFEARNDFIARRIFNNMNEESFPPGATRQDFKLLKLGSYFHGSEKEKPKVYGLTESYDITKEVRQETDEDLITDNDKEVA